MNVDFYPQLTLMLQKNPSKTADAGFISGHKRL